MSAHIHIKKLQTHEQSMMHKQMHIQQITSTQTHMHEDASAYGMTCTVVWIDSACTSSFILSHFYSRMNVKC